MTSPHLGAASAAETADRARLIFLDLDGVICCNNYAHLEPDKLEQLQRVVAATGACVVLSSDWRRGAQMKRIARTALRNYGIRMIGSTPCHQSHLHLRPQEITTWISNYKSATEYGISKPALGSWIAIDDRCLTEEYGGRDLVGHFVQTEYATGLTEDVANHCIQVLLQPADHDPAADGLSDGAPLPGTERETSVYMTRAEVPAVPAAFSARTFALGRLESLSNRLSGPRIGSALRMRLRAPEQQAQQEQPAAVPPPPDGNVLTHGGLPVKAHDEDSDLNLSVPHRPQNRAANPTAGRRARPRTGDPNSASMGNLVAEASRADAQFATPEQRRMSSPIMVMASPPAVALAVSD